ncbi:hypothetical protein SISNIDRAFT_471671 [Sistotremastrum niveocremeum HHB9708]|uniref:Protein kinase domain-containing protein n=1 Tax=Sistotremastrum niveocremeum HHB9708 TaxID=1314777 RepID=A0A164MCJ5_9AGAM|nr:hypothetical protein SISNIDRAFT_471671 [Sistotremastrum niveocremeum HHB9708]
MPLSPDINANLIKSLKVVQSIGEAVPHGGILKAVAGIGITILETAERVRQNKEECADIARRAAEDIGVLKRLDEDNELSEDLIERLERYHKVGSFGPDLTRPDPEPLKPMAISTLGCGILEEVLQRVERLGTESRWKQTLRASSVQEETKDCLDRLNEAFRMYMFQFSLAADTKLTKILNRMEVMILSADSTSPADPEEPDEIRRIPTDHITFIEEISCKNMKGYTVRFGKARMVDRAGHQKAVIVKKFQAMDACEDAARDAFDNEVEIRRDLLHASFARMLGVSIASRRTKIIVIEAGTIAAYDYLQNLPSLEYLLEHMRIWTGYSATNRWQAGYRFLGEHGGSWRGGCEGQAVAYGRIGENGWPVGGFRVADVRSILEALREEQLTDGNDGTGAGNASFEEHANRFQRMREAVRNWGEERTKENGRDLFYWLWWWSGPSEKERGTENSRSVGDIEWEDGNGWHPIPLVHHFPLADSPEYDINASQWRDGEWETIAGTQIGEFTRWSIDVVPAETVYLRMYVLSVRTYEIFDFFYGSALSLARDFGVDVRSLRLVSRAGFIAYASLAVFNELSFTVYYFAYPPYSDGSMPDPPGFWSLCFHPHCSDCRLHVDAA